MVLPGKNIEQETLKVSVWKQCVWPFLKQLQTLWIWLTTPETVAWLQNVSSQRELIRSQISVHSCQMNTCHHRHFFILQLMLPAPWDYSRLINSFSFRKTCRHVCYFYMSSCFVRVFMKKIDLPRYFIFSPFSINWLWHQFNFWYILKGVSWKFQKQPLVMPQVLGAPVKTPWIWFSEQLKCLVTVSPKGCNKIPMSLSLTPVLSRRPYHSNHLHLVIQDREWTVCLDLTLVTWLPWVLLATKSGMP